MKNSFIALLMILSLSSYGQDRESKYREALAAHNLKVVSSFYDLLEQKDYGQLKNIIDFDGTAVWTDQSKEASDTLKGREAIGSKFKSSVDGFYKVKYSTKANEGADPTLISVKVKELLQSADGVKTQKSYLAVFKLKNGKIVEYTEYNNPTPAGRS